MLYFHKPFLLAFFFLFFLIFTPAVHAYLPNSAFTLPLSSELRVGTIIAETAEGYAAASSNSSESVVGILVADADFIYLAEETTDRPIVSSGIVPVLLSSEMGQITKGTPITVSKTQPGIGVKAQEQDIIIGVAQESTNSISPSLKKVEVRNGYKIEFSQSLKDNSVLAQELENLVKQSSSKIVSADTNPTVYLLAIIVVILAAIFSFILFGRVAINGINALGRNPLAKSAIITGIIINSLLIIAFVIGVLFAAAYIVGW